MAGKEQRIITQAYRAIVAVAVAVAVKVQLKYNDISANSSQAVSRKSLRLSTHRASNILGRTGYHV